MPETTTVLKPTEKTLRLLYAKSGNRCAFPNCPTPISDGQTLLGEAAHIKAESPGGPRYDPSKSPEERRSFENLILLCRIHHKLVDSDPISYTVDRLKQMKIEHEAKAGKIADSEAEEVAKLLFGKNVSVTANNPYNSITAGVFTQNITNTFAPPSVPTEIGSAYRGVPPKQGSGRFRAKGEPIGKAQPIMPFLLTSPENIYVNDNTPCFWFRMLPNQAPKSEWTFRDLDVAAGEGTAFRLVTMRGYADYRLAARDGIGRYMSVNPGIAYTLTFLFRVGELWSIDTELCVDYQPNNLFAVTEARKGLPNLIKQSSAILAALKIPAPFQWIVGIEDVEGYALAFERRNGPQFRRPVILTPSIIAQGLYSPGDDTSGVVDSFSKKVFAECGDDQPDDIV